ESSSTSSIPRSNWSVSSSGSDMQYDAGGFGRTTGGFRQNAMAPLRWPREDTQTRRISGPQKPSKRRNITGKTPIPRNPWSRTSHSRNHRVKLLSFLGAAAGLLALSAQSSDARQSMASEVLTRPEQTNYNETSRYADVEAFTDVVAGDSPRIHKTYFGYTLEGRALPLLVFGDVAGPDPASVHATGKTRVFIQANIHAGEVEGKEAMLMLLRDLASGLHA